jgi:hypothetical protein
MINIDLDNAITLTLTATIAYADLCDIDLADLILDLTDDFTPNTDIDATYDYLIRACRSFDITPDELMTRTYAITDA